MNGVERSILPKYFDLPNQRISCLDSINMHAYYMQTNSLRRTHVNHHTYR